MNDFQDIATRLNFSININKTRVMGVAKIPFKELNVQFAGSLMPKTKEIRLLGRTITSNLNDRTQRMLNETKKAMNIFKYLNNVKTGLRPKAGLALFHSIIRSRTEYARTTWMEPSKNTTRKVATLLNGGLRRALGLPPSSPVPFLYALAGELPFKFRTQWLTAKELAKAFVNNREITKHLNGNRTSSYSCTYAKFEQIYRKLRPVNGVRSTTNIAVRMDLLEGSSKKGIPLAELRGRATEKIQFYYDSGYHVLATDASVLEDATGIAVYDPAIEMTIAYKINEKISSTAAELTAILKACEYAVANNIRSFVVFTDSRNSCLALLKEKTNKNHLVQDIRNLLDTNQDFCMTVEWIPGHAGVEINEVADAEAKLAGTSGLEMETPVTYEEALNRIFNSIWNDWSTEYAEWSEGRHEPLACKIDKPQKKIFNSNMNLSAYEAKLLYRLYIDQTYNKAFLHKINLQDNDLCDLCLVKEDNNHIFFECQKYDSVRCSMRTMSSYTNLREALISANEGVLFELLNFARKAKITI